MENSTAASVFPVLLNKQQVCERLRICERTLELKVEGGAFPPPVRFGKTVVWDERALQTYLAAQFAKQLAWQPASARKGRRSAKTKTA
jgi:predicted DNA-binding transcriptional regulator AlpA